MNTQDDAADRAELARLQTTLDMLLMPQERKDSMLTETRKNKAIVDAAISNHERIVKMKDFSKNAMDMRKKMADYDIAYTRLHTASDFLGEGYLQTREKDVKQTIKNIKLVMNKKKEEADRVGASPFDTPWYSDMIYELCKTETYLHTIRIHVEEQQMMLRKHAQPLADLMYMFLNASDVALKQALEMCTSDNERSEIKEAYKQIKVDQDEAIRVNYERVIMSQPEELRWNIARAQLLDTGHTGVKTVVLATSLLTPHLSIDQLLTLTNVTKLSIRPLPETLFCEKWVEVFGYTDVIKRLGKYIADARCLTHMHIEVDLNGQDFGTLLSDIAKSNTLTYLVLESIHFTGDHCIHIARFLRESTIIQNLRIIAGFVSNIDETFITTEGLRQRGNREITWRWNVGAGKDRLNTYLQEETIGQRQRREQTWWQDSMFTRDEFY